MTRPATISANASPSSAPELRLLRFHSFTAFLDPLDMTGAILYVRRVDLSQHADHPYNSYNPFEKGEP